MRAIIAKSFGGPDVYELTKRDAPTPGLNEIQVEVTVSGVNFVDVYQRNGASALVAPYHAGVEGVGVVAAVGDDVPDIGLGDRVGWFAGGQGSFADVAVVDAAKVVPVPDGVNDETAAALLMQGATAHYLATDAYAITPGDTVLVHAAAGGVGHLLTQIAKRRGAVVIGTTSSPVKAEIALRCGADHVATYDDFPETSRAVTDGAGVAVAYDGNGGSTFDGSLASVRRRGTVVVFGAASGPVPPLDVSRLAAAGSVYLTWPTIGDYIATRAELRTRFQELFRWAADGELVVEIGARFDLPRVSEAFSLLESRRSTGKILLTH